MYLLPVYGIHTSSISMTMIFGGLSAAFTKKLQQATRKNTTKTFDFNIILALFKNKQLLVNTWPFLFKHECMNILGKQMLFFKVETQRDGVTTS